MFRGSNTLFVRVCLPDAFFSRGNWGVGVFTLTVQRSGFWIGESSFLYTCVLCIEYNTMHFSTPLYIILTCY